MVPTSKFNSGDKILCFHGPLLYEAKILKLDIKNSKSIYFVHYSGWNKNWDEWVNDSRMLEINEKNLKRQKELQNSVLAAKKNKTPQSGQKKGTPTEKEKKGSHAEKKTSTPTAPKSIKPKTLVTPPAVKHESRKISRSRPNERSGASSAPVIKSEFHETPLVKHEDDDDDDDSSIVSPRRIPVAQKKIQSAIEESTETTNEEQPQVRLKLPNNLMLHIVDDFDMINNKKKLFRLPAQIPVNNLIAEYISIRAKEDGMTINERTGIEEVCNGIEFYFNATLQNQLLYAYERPQLHNLIAQNPDKLMSQLYGPFHLLRLLSKLQTLLSYTRIDKEGADLISRQSSDFINFLSNSEDKYFDFSEYDAAPSEHSELPSL